MIILEFCILMLALVVICIGALWLLGGWEPVYKIGGKAPVFFVALKHRDKRARSAEVLARGVEVQWAVNADFPLIGADQAYWDRFLILAGGTSDAMPLKLPDNVEDVYVARLALGRPPRIVLGVIRMLVSTGLWKKPGGDVSADRQNNEFRQDIMPDAAAIRTLLAQPRSYKPAMMNFLKYYPTARYAEAREGVAPVSGRAAYGRYGIVALQTVYKTGGHLVFYGKVDAVIREAQDGPTLDLWDDLAVMQYVEPRGILSMEQVEKYRNALHHRDAALERSIVIASSPL
jgi:hypothetical protein